METLQQGQPVGIRLTPGFAVIDEFGQSRIENRKQCAGFGPLGHHPSTYHVFYDFIFPILPLHLQQVVAEVKEVKAPLLSKENNDRATRPVQTISKALPGGRNRVTGWWVGRDDRIELGKRSTMAPGTFFGEFLGKLGSVLLLESEYTPREN